MVEDVVLSMGKKPSSGSNATASAEVVNGKRKGTSRLQLSRGKGPIKLYHILHVSKIAHKLVFVASLSDNGHTVKFTENRCVMKMKRNSVGVGRRTERT